MKVDINDKLQGEIAANEIDLAVQILKEELGESSDLVSSTWTFERDERGRAMAHLRLADFTGTVEAKFAPGELRDEPQLRKRLHWLWGDLLQIRSHKQVEKLQGMVKQLEGE